MIQCHYRSIFGGLIPLSLIAASGLLTGCQSGPINFTGAGDLEAQSRHNQEEWWSQKASLPVGARQVYKKGKMWPPYPRPTGEEQQASHVYHANHYWPHPYACDDRKYVETIFETHAANGWVEATTLYDYHFDRDHDELTHNGREQLDWILKHVPKNRRIAFIEQLPGVEVNQARMQNVQMVAAEIAGEPNVPPIMLRLTSPYGRPAGEIDAIRRKEIESLRAPRISYGTDTGGAEIAKTGDAEN